MELIYLPQADLDLDRLYDFLIHSKANLNTADKAILAIKEGVSSLVDFPSKGIEIDSSGRRELYIAFGKNSYTVRYFVDYDYQKILILRIWHSREDRELS